MSDVQEPEVEDEVKISAATVVLSEQKYVIVADVAEKKTSC